MWPTLMAVVSIADQVERESMSTFISVSTLGRSRLASLGHSWDWFNSTHPFDSLFFLSLPFILTQRISLFSRAGAEFYRRRRRPDRKRESVLLASFCSIGLPHFALAFCFSRLDSIQACVKSFFLPSTALFSVCILLSTDARRASIVKRRRRREIVYAIYIDDSSLFINEYRSQIAKVCQGFFSPFFLSFYWWRMKIFQVFQ